MTEFERLGWGTMENKRDDDGSDVFALAKAEDLVGLRLLVGLQVKTGPSYFKTPGRDESAAAGWWFAEDDESHFDDWLNFSVPHLVVLHDLTLQKSFWVHVTQDRVDSTGQGRKIFVPAAQQIDEANRVALEEVAKSGRRVATWEGSIWNKPALNDPREALRHALLTPRLVSPHANAVSARELSAPAAVAMLCEARIQELHRFGLMAPSLPSGHDSWGWRLFLAVRAALVDTDVESLREVAMGTGRGNVAVTAAAAAAGWLTADGRPDEAIAVVRGKLSLRLSQVDRAWLNLQLARAHVEVGQIATARAGAQRVLTARDRYPGDATASALGAAASILLFNTAPPQEHDLSQVITGVDVAPMWWLTQMEFGGLSAGLKKGFERWCRSEAVTIGSGQPEINKRIASANVSSFLGDQSSWAQISSYVGQSILVLSPRPSQHDECRRGIHTLLAAGDERAVAQATRAIVDDGPTDVVRRAASKLDLHNQTKSVAPAVLSFLQAAGDILDRPTANRVVDQVLHILRDPAPFVERTAPTYLLYDRLFEVLEAVLPAASAARRRRTAKYLTELKPDAPLPIEVPVLARLCSYLQPSDWPSGASQRVLGAIQSYEEPLRSSIVKSAVAPDEGDRWLREAICLGNVSAMQAFGDVRALEPAQVRAMIRLHESSVRKRVREARQGSIIFGGSDPTSDLVVLNAWHPDQAEWSAVVAFLRCREIPPQSKRNVLRLLATFLERVPAPDRSKIISVGRSLLEAKPSHVGSPFETGREAWGASAMLMATAGVEPELVRSAQLRLLRSDVGNRQWGLRLTGRLARPSDIGVLIAMTGASEPGVRAVATEQLAWLSARSKIGVEAEAALQHAVQDPGSLVQRFAAAALSGASKRDDFNPSAVARAVIQLLASSVSAEVRAYAADASAAASA